MKTSYATMDDFYLIESQNKAMRDEILELEHHFATTVGENFFEVSEQQIELESHFEK